MSDDLPNLVLQRNRERYGTFSWLGQAPQYDQLGEPNELRYQRFYDGRPLTGEGKATIDTLLHYDADGHLDGILNTFPYGAKNSDGSTLDDPGNSAIVIRPDQDTPAGGVRELLETEALRRWPDIIIDVATDVVLARKIPTKPIKLAADRTLEDGNRRISSTSHLNK